MKNNIYVKLYKILIIFLIIYLWSCSNESVSEDCENKSEKIIKYYNNEEYENISDMFFLSSELSKEEIAIYRKYTIIILFFFRKKYGKILEKELSNINNEYYNISFSIMELSFWDTKPYGYQINYKVKYEKLGSGILSITYYNNNNLFYIKYITFGLLKSEKNLMITKNIWNEYLLILKNIEKNK